MELLIGCGNRRDKQMWPADKAEWQELVTLDIDPNCSPDVEHNLERLPLPFPDNHFDEIHAYHVLEHTGRQGDFRFFFAQWSDFWRMLKPDGVFMGMVPGPTSEWVWGDPGHTRQFHPCSLTFLDQDEYTKQIGRNALADYRHVYRADFQLRHCQTEQEQFCFWLTAVKPSRISI